MRIFRLIATPVILLGLLGLLAWGALWGWNSLTAPLPSPSPTPCVTQTSAVVTPPQVSVRIYNGGFTSGQASRVQTKFQELGFNVVRIGNTEERVKTLTVRANKSQQAQIDLVASQFVEPTIDYDDRVDGTVDVLLPTDNPVYNDKALKEVAAVDGAICVVPSKSPSPTPTPTPEP